MSNNIKEIEKRLYTLEETEYKGIRLGKVKGKVNKIMYIYTVVRHTDGKVSKI